MPKTTSFTNNEYALAQKGQDDFSFVLFENLERRNQFMGISNHYNKTIIHNSIVHLRKLVGSLCELNLDDFKELAAALANQKGQAATVAELLRLIVFLEAWEKQL